MPLSETWFVEGRIDFELQQYRLLAYLQEVEHCFKNARLYPQLSDLVAHYNNLTEFRKNKQFLQEHFPRKIDEVSLKRATIIYEQLLSDDSLMKELQDITTYAAERMKSTLEAGTNLYDEVERTMTVAPVGINPPYNSEGYLLLRWGTASEVWAYRYSVTLFEHEKARFRGLKMQYLNAWPHNYIYTLQYIKQELVRSNSALKNPAVYEVQTSLSLPLTETVLPVAKRIFVRYLAAQ